MHQELVINLWLEFHRKEHVDNILMKTFCIFVLHVNASVFVQNVSFMVIYYFIFR